VGAALNLQVRSMTRQELGLALDWADREGWNPGLNDGDCFHAADADGFLIGCLGGEPVACISSVRYGKNYGFIGFYIVRPELRGRGYGMRMWQAGMTRLADRVVGLDGVTAQQNNYKRSGFVLAHCNIRFGGAPHLAAVQDARLTRIDRGWERPILDYDLPFFPDVRTRFLQCWLSPDHRTALALIEDGTVQGYGVIRTCRRGFKIGPLFANSEQTADLLFRGLAVNAKGEPVYLDCPEPNRSATDLAMRYGLSPVFETARMYRGLVPDISLPRTYGITTFELG
jgi:GNAT superfamily N-acetyltransferase